MRDHVARVRELLEDSTRPRRRIETKEDQERRAFEYFEQNVTPAMPLEQTPEARAVREIGRIVSWYGWRGEVDRALDAAGAGQLQDLTSEQLLALQARMARLEQCAQDGCDPPDAPAAR